MAAYAPRPTVVVEGIVYHIGERKEFGTQTPKGYTVSVQTPSGSDENPVGGYLEVRYALDQELPTLGEEVCIVAEYNSWAMPATETAPPKNGVVLSALAAARVPQSA